MRISCLGAMAASVLVCTSALADPIGYTETFTGSNMGWEMDEDYNANLLTDWSSVSYESNHIWAYYPAAPIVTKTTLMFADSGSSDPQGTLAGNVDYSSAPGLSVSVWLSTTETKPTVTFFLASNNNTGSSTLNTSTDIWYDFYGADPDELGTSPYTFTRDFNSDDWVHMRGTNTTSLSQALADVDAIGVMVTDAGETTYKVYIDDFTVTPEPATLLMMGPMAGFLGWKVFRRRRKGIAPAR